MYHHADTIYALSSGSLPSGVAVVRISGSLTTEIVASLTGRLPAPRMASLSTIRDRNNQVLDQALVLFFPGPASFTGEDCCELQLHGGRALVRAVLDELRHWQGARPAEAGEFTQRAFRNGKIDLAEAESLADLLVADTEMQRRLAQSNAGGGLSKLYQGWARRITHARAMIEAELDFSDEGDVPGSVADAIWADMQSLQMDIGNALQRSASAEIVRDGFVISIVGEPNVGKSSLLNHLAARDVAIVTDIAGTTRDILAVDLDIGGFKVKLQDTAGLRTTSDVVEQIGVKRSLEAVKSSDLVLHLVSSAEGLSAAASMVGAKSVIRVGTKADLSGAAGFTDVDVNISVHQGTGIDSLLKRIEEHLGEMLDIGSTAIPSRERHFGLLAQCLRYLGEAIDDVDAPLEIRAEALRAAAESIGRITGRVDTEGLLSVIFSEFCIGK